LFSTGYSLPEEAKVLAIGCLIKPYNERQLKNALEAVDSVLAGEKAKPVKGVEIYPPEAA
jgi:hypothetical protein